MSQIIRYDRPRIVRLPGRDHFWQRWVIAYSECFTDVLGYDCTISYAVLTPFGFRHRYAY